MKKWIVFATVCGLISPLSVMCDTLKVSYLERPPYYHTEQGNASGFLIELSKKIFQDAGVDVVFVEEPPNRIIAEIQKPDSFRCSVGWFKKPEREQFAKFSLPIYQDKPFVILTTKKQRQLFAPHTTLEQVFSDKSLVMATLSTFSYGPFIDQMMTDISPTTREITSEQKVLPKLIVAGRVSYMLVAPEEFETLLRSAEVDPDDFVTVTMPDIPVGNKRYLMFGKDVSDEIIDRTNLSIKKFVSQDILP